MTSAATPCAWGFDAVPLEPSLPFSGLDDPSFKDSDVLEALTIVVSQPIQLFTPSSVSFMKSGASRKHLGEETIACFIS